MRTPQQDLLVVEALVDYSWKLEDANPDRSYRAWVLAQEFARQHGLTTEDALRQREQISKFSSGRSLTNNEFQHSC
ncbi:hypothetical protein AArc1_5042 (plasmid) [Natrarchaeobaculum sulfurireducens]|nr:hypothetical protein AArc1_5042 [Natrarchaeobaculum sulfurireducens]